MAHVLRLVLALLVLLAGIGGGADAGEIRRARMASTILGHELPYLVYVPTGYDASNERYPVLYLLHGAGGNETTWVDSGHINETADRLIATGAIRPSLIIIPGCPQSWWIDGARDKVESAFWNELVPSVDHSYRTIASREGRVIAGLSAGGYGAVRYGLKYPDRVAAVAALSPAVYADSPPAESTARREPAFLEHDGRFSQDSWAKHNYPHLLSGYFAQRYRVPMWLVSGDSDKLGIAFETALLHKRLMSVQPDLVEFRVMDGGHTWALWRTAIADAMTYVLRFTAPRRISEHHPHPAAVTGID